MRKGGCPPPQYAADTLSCPLSAESGTGYREGIYSEYASTIYALTAAIDTKDHYTFSHSKNVAVYAASFAKACGLNTESVAIIEEAALLHDIGKIDTMPGPRCPSIVSDCWLHKELRRYRR